eukprot:gnl/TRDRNA2_/TRDRNA2_167657_c0_seq1.p1 gnl/TRDRNA2_/TRDRNA2_167657_c0~~gnl/TRDRNA2_/TRDRNA2_167657_c0_seq1.p1  ORF type:complete len:367 (+),score=42.75 gnl/TRDRNA2_/TRDRNA2_167657_c0_seq1:56-1156(+)
MHKSSAFDAKLVATLPTHCLGSSSCHHYLCTWRWTSSAGYDVYHARPMQKRPCNGSTAAFPPIDFVYCWTGEAAQHNFTGVLQSGFGEMRYSIRSLEKFAPWFNKVYILVNGQEELPRWLTALASQRIEMVDRCKLFDRPDDCPTFNNAACQAVMHKVPNLEEHFVAIEDDMLLTRCLQPKDFFFAAGKPLIFMPLLALDAQKQVYGNATGEDLPRHVVPYRVQPFFHIPFPMLRSFAHAQEEHFHEWFSYVRSHKHRFKCCGSTPRGDRLDEDFRRVYPAMLFNSGVGVVRPAEDGYCEFGQARAATSSSLKCLAQKLEDKQFKFANLNGVHTPESWHAVQHLLLDTLGGAPPSRLILPGSLEPE